MASTEPIFSLASQRRHVDAVVSSLPHDKRRLILGFVKTDGTVQVAYIERFTPHWTAGFLLAYAPVEDWSGQVVLKGEW